MLSVQLTISTTSSQLRLQIYIEMLKEKIIVQLPWIIYSKYHFYSMKITVAFN